MGKPKTGAVVTSKSGLDRVLERASGLESLSDAVRIETNDAIGRILGLGDTTEKDKPVINTEYFVTHINGLLTSIENSLLSIQDEIGRLSSE